MTDLNRAKAYVDNLPLVQLAPDELAHYGVLGMKWGRRKPESIARDRREARAERYARNTRQKLAVGTLGASVAIPAAARAIKRRQEATKARQSEDYKESRALLKKKRPELSNKDIQRIVDRLQKEQKLSQLNPSQTQRGKKAVLGVIAAAGTAAGVYNLIKSPAGQAAVKRGAAIVSGFMQSNGKHVLREVVKTGRHLA